jgi:malonate-semialdehyde dehydrogenase (acetylating) / methylmalonate-semialdehyde dehydrogenase
MRTINHWINGRTVDTQPERTGAVYDPATGQQTAQVAYATGEDVDAAVQAAQAAFPAWRDTPVVKRARVMFRFLELLQRNRDELARIIASEHGKVVPDAVGEIQRGMEVVEVATGIPHLLKGDFSENVSTEVDCYSIRQPVGVAAGITPFNFPIMVPMWMHPIAIACGNAFVLKPSERDPSVSTRVAELYAEAGLPDGVFNVVHGDKVAVDAILDHPGIAAVSFVGSTPIARYIYERGTSHGKRVQALGGAKNHAIVMPDSDMDSAADALVSAAYGSTGQRCMAISTAVAVGKAGDALIDKVLERAERLRTGPGLDPSSDMGPLVTGVARDKVAGLIETGVNEGAKLVLDGRGVRVEGHEEGFYVGPTLFDEVRPHMEIYKQEIFGPVLIVLRVADIDEAIQMINDNPYGNGTAIFTANGAAVRKFQNEVQVGMIGVNIPIPVPMAFYSFGGWKDSLFGDLHVHGPEGVAFYTRGKVVTTRWPVPRDSAVELGFPTSR